jgi:hypothetical protein
VSKNEHEVYVVIHRYLYTHESHEFA